MGAAVSNSHSEPRAPATSAAGWPPCASRCSPRLTSRSERPSHDLAARCFVHREKSRSSRCVLFLVSVPLDLAPRGRVGVLGSGELLSCRPERAMPSVHLCAAAGPAVVPVQAALPTRAAARTDAHVRLLGHLLLCQRRSGRSASGQDRRGSSQRSQSKTLSFVAGRVLAAR